MTKRINKGRNLIFSSVVALTAVIGTSSPALAANVDTYKVCYDDQNCGTDWAEGSITWYNRTAGIQGHVQSGAGCDNGVDSTQVAFEAYAGSTKIDTQTRTTRGACADLPYNFTIGDPDLVGGIDRVKITICVFTTGERYCGPPKNTSKN